MKKNTPSTKSRLIRTQTAVRVAHKFASRKKSIPSISIEMSKINPYYKSMCLHS